MAFLLYNVYPAKVFMGDTGARRWKHGAASAYIMKMPLFILLVCLIYLLKYRSYCRSIFQTREENGCSRWLGIITTSS